MLAPLNTPAFLLMLSALTASGQVTSDINRSIWKQKYGVLDGQINDVGWMAQDADGDGVKNSDELAAGTNPFKKSNAEPHFRTPLVTEQPSSLTLEFPTVPGKFYQAETSDELTSWIAGSLPGTIGDGSRKSLVVGKNSGHFFRVRVSDTTSHGDQISDWAKLQLGFSLSTPLSAQTSYQAASLSTALADQNAVSVSVVEAHASQPTSLGGAVDTAVIRVSRSGSIVPGAVKVPLVISGSAVAGIDYTALPSTVEFPPGVNAVDFKIVPLYNAARTSPGTVIVTLGSPGGATSFGNYRIGNPSFGAVTIDASGAAIGTGLTAQLYNGASSTYTNLLNFGGETLAYSYVRNTGSTTVGSATVTYSGTPATPVTVGSQVQLQFASGPLNVSAFNVGKTYTVIAPVTATSFSVAINGTSLPSNGTGNLAFGNFFKPLVRVEPLIDNFYYQGTPNGVSTIGIDNYSVTWDTNLSPTTGGDYVFQLDADDKARVLLDKRDGNGLVQILENGWDTPATGGFKQSGIIPLAIPSSPADRYILKVEYVEITGNAKCRLQWKVGTGAFANLPTNVAYRDNTSATTGWSAKYYNNTTFSGNPATSQFDSSVTATNNGEWGTGYPDPDIRPDYFTIRWSGQVLPRYTQKYWFVARVDDGVKLWVNDQLIINRWPGGSVADQTGAIDLKGGVYYNIVMEYYEAASSAEAHLSWYSEDQAKQIIPTNRLFPAPVDGLSGTAPILAKPTITSATDAVTVMGSGSPFTMEVSSSNSGVITAQGLPAWLTLTNGVLSGTPPAPGIYQFTLTTTNELGSSSVIMTIEVVAGEGKLTREVWNTGVTGASLSDVPWHLAPSSKDTISQAENLTASGGTNTGERLRGYFVAPSTANYYFWIAASNVAELWISNDGEPVNKILRAKVTGPTGTGSREWNAQPSQKSQWLSLIAGRKYYFEALHNTGSSGSSNHLSIGWFADPTGNTVDPITNGSGVIPSYVLSPFDYPPTTAVAGDLYVANLQGAEGLTNISGSGGSFLRVSGSEAVLQLHHAGLSSGIISRKVYNSSGQLIFDIGAQERNYPVQQTSDGGYSLQLSGANLTDLANGGVSVKIATVNHPDGELTGIYGKVKGSQIAPTIPAQPAWTDEHTSNDGANSRFLTQATFGPSPGDLSYVKANGYRAWIDQQFAIPSTKNLDYVIQNLSNDPQNAYTNKLIYNSWWKNSVTAPDQLRQRTAFALSQILVTSSAGPLNNNGRGLAVYYDTLLDQAFVNFRDVLKNVTLAPAMGVYLDMRGNSLGNMVNGTHPNENYAREILQLFSAGLYRVWPDGTLVLDSHGMAVPTYNQNVITGFARVFTGWNWGQALPSGGRLPTNFGPASNYFDPMILVPARHELGSKRLLDNVVLPPAIVTNSSDTSTDPTSTYTVQSVDPALGQGNVVTTTITNRYDINGLRDLEQSLDNIMNNPAVAPFICRQLIQRLVTSHPKPEYVHRVVRAFNGERNVDGIATGVKGDMKEVLRAILLDYEARSSTAAGDATFGKQREPLLRITGMARSFPAPSFPNSRYRQLGLNQILVTTQTPHRLVNGEVIRLADFVDDGGSTLSAPPASTGGYTVANAAAISYSLVGSTGIATITAPGFQAGDTVAIQFLLGTLGNHALYKTLRDYTVVSATPTSFTIDIGNTTLGNVGTTANGAQLPKNFMVNTVNYVSGNYTSNGSSVVVTASSLIAGQKVYVRFSTGGLASGSYDGEYTVAAATATDFTINLSSSPTNTTGVALVPKFSGGYVVTTTTTSSSVELYTSGAHHLVVGDKVYVNFLVTNKSGTYGPAPNGIYTVSEIKTPNVFKVDVNTPSNAGSQSSGGMIAFPLVTPLWNRSGKVTVELAHWDINATVSELGQTPMNSPTVFNFFYPDYRFPGPTSQAGMTTPEFQLTNVSGTMALTNTVTTNLLSAGNPNGYSSFKNNGSIMMDLSPYMTQAQTENAGIPALVDKLSLLMIGRTLGVEQRSIVVDYVSNTATGYFPYSSPPTNMQMRDRVRAIVHLIATSSEYAIQK